MANRYAGYPVDASLSQVVNGRRYQFIVDEKRDRGIVTEGPGDNQYDRGNVRSSH
jgi:hypothetical protein